MCNNYHKLNNAVYFVYLSHILVYSIGIQGMGSFFTSKIPNVTANLNIEELSALRRYSVSDSLISSLLRGLRMCL